MTLFNYDNLIQAIKNVELRETKERVDQLQCLKDKCEALETSLINDGIMADWYRLKLLCQHAHVRLCVSSQAQHSIGCVMGIGDHTYCKSYQDNGWIAKRMSSGSHWLDDYGFTYYPSKGIIWETHHLTTTHIFTGFDENNMNSVEKKYSVRLELLEEFRDTYENYRKFLLNKVEAKYGPRIKAEDIINIL